jgi:hypothetical protein
VCLTARFLALFTAASPLYLESAACLAVAAFHRPSGGVRHSVFSAFRPVPRTTFCQLRVAIPCHQECISTPLIPVYLAAVLAYSNSWRLRALALARGCTALCRLGIARLLVVALPAALIGSPLFLVHAFYQLLLAARRGVRCRLLAPRRGATAWRRALLGGALGAVFVYLLGSSYTVPSRWRSPRVLRSMIHMGAIALLPAFQVGLYVALFVAAFGVLSWLPFVTGLAVLGLSQLAVFTALHFVVRHAALMPHVRDVRAWALAGPLLVVAAMVTY